MFLTQQSVQLEKGTSSASVAQVHRRVRGVRRRQSRVVRRAGAGDGAGRADRAVASCSPRRFASPTPRIKSGAANPAPKLATLIAGMCAGADSIDDLDVVRAGGMKTLFDGVYAPSTIGTLLREFTFGHARQLESVLREHLVALCRARRSAARRRRAGVHRHRLAAAPGLRTRQTGRLLRAHQDRRQAGPAQGTVAAGHHDQHRAAPRR